MGKKILVVEDNPDAREVLLTILTGKGFAVIAAEDGLQALELFENGEPDLIITDIEMPRLNGIELIMRLREDFQALSVPIVALSGSHIEMLDKAKDVGATQAISKPVGLTSLLNLVNELLS